MTTEVRPVHARVGQSGTGQPVRGFEVVAGAIGDVCGGHVFGLMGDGNMAVLATLDARGGARYVSARHEASAVTMASGYARVTGHLGVCTVTHGPGLTNALTALRAAVMDRSPLLLLLGELPEDQEHNLQYVDHAAFVAPTGATVRRVADPEQLDRGVRWAAAYAVAQRVPVVLQLAHEALFATTKTEPPAAASETPGPAPSRRASKQLREDARDVAALLRAADRPLLLVGRGVVLASAQPAVVTLAERTGALVGTTLAAKNACSQASHHVGVVGGFAHPDTAALVRDSDLVLALGASLNEFTTAHGALLQTAKVVQVDESAAALGRITPCDRYVLADVAAFLAALMDEWGDHTRAIDAERASAASRTRHWAFEDASDESGVDPRSAVGALDACLPPERVAVIDGGHLIEWGSRHLQRGTVERWLPALGAGSIGLSTSLGLGAAIGSGAPTLVLVGDGSMMMALSVIDDAVRAAAPVCFAVLNDGAYAAEVHKLRRLGLPDRLGWFGRPDLAAVARSLGAASRTVATPDDVTRLAGGDWLDSLARGPVVLDVHVTPSVVSARLATR